MTKKPKYRNELKIVINDVDKPSLYHTTFQNSNYSNILFLLQGNELFKIKFTISENVSSHKILSQLKLGKIEDPRKMYSVLKRTPVLVIQTTKHFYFVCCEKLILLRKLPTNQLFLSAFFNEIKTDECLSSPKINEILKGIGEGHRNYY